MRLECDAISIEPYFFALKCPQFGGIWRNLDFSFGFRTRESRRIPLNCLCNRSAGTKLAPTLGLDGKPELAPLLCLHTYRTKYEPLHPPRFLLER